jgi:preprotein translocase SecE subunit
MAKRRLKGAKKPTVREQMSASQAEKPRRRLKTAGRGLWQKLLNARKQEYYLPLPKGRTGQFLNKRRSIIPRYFKEAAAELKQVTWPTRRETWKMAFAVFLFAFAFGLVIAIVDFGLDKIFRKVLLKS